MDLFETGRTLHATVGIVGLVSFWIAASARKGSPRHRLAGRIYLPSMIAVISISGMMVASRALAGDPGIAVFLAFLISMVGAASYLMWFSTRWKDSPERITGIAYRVIATWLVLAGAAIFVLGVVRTIPLAIFLSLLGFSFGLYMWRAVDSRRWLTHHLNGVFLNSIATHDSFAALVIGSMFPQVDDGVPRMLVAVAVTATALTARMGLSRKYERTRTATASCTPATAASRS